MLVKVHGDSVNLVFENDSGILIKKGNSEEIKEELILNENISAPIKKGDILGKMNYYLDNQLACSVNLLSDSDISKKTLLNTFEYISLKWLNLLR